MNKKVRYQEVIADVLEIASAADLLLKERTITERAASTAVFGLVSEMLETAMPNTDDVEEETLLDARLFILRRRKDEIWREKAPISVEAAIEASQRAGKQLAEEEVWQGRHLDDIPSSFSKNAADAAADTALTNHGVSERLTETSGTSETDDDGLPDIAGGEWSE